MKIRRTGVAFGITALISMGMSNESLKAEESRLESITLGAGCFWCTEAVMQRVEGVKGAVSGYMGGHVKNPTYRQVVTGETGHAEVAKITFDPNVTSLEELLDIFWLMHDPTTLNRQGADVGTQYRSAIYYNNDNHKDKILSSKEAYQNELNKNKLGVIETEIKKIETYYYAEDYHQQYLAIEGSRQYCSASPTKVKLGSFNGSNYKLPKEIWDNFNWDVEKCVLRSNNKPIEINN